jgi:hypothetical protein
MPGASPEVLTLASVDLEKLTRACHLVEVALARGHRLELISYALDEAPHVLEVDIGGWKRLPVASTGVIPDGVWGNVPSGETYIAPVEGSGSGSVVINGSIPGLVVEADQQIVLHFAKGILSKIEPESNATAKHLFQTQIQKARMKNDQNWRNLAEIGFGLNAAVSRLTGNMLYDEKALGTAHVALGSNTFMGGNVESSIHCDMVINSPTILIDGKTILERGNLCFSEKDWHENHTAVSLAESPLSAAQEVTRSGIETVVDNHQLLRIMRPEPGRVATCPIGDNETSRLARDIFGHLPREGEWIAIDELASDTDLDPRTTLCVLHILWDYEIINYR